MRPQLRAQHPFHELDLRLFHQPGIAEQVFRAIQALQFVKNFFRDGHSCFLSVKHRPDQSYTENWTFSPVGAASQTISASNQIVRATRRSRASVKAGQFRVWQVGGVGLLMSSSYQAG